MTFDIFIGFTQEPKNLEAFMQAQGYTHVEREKDGGLVFERNDHSWPQAFYFPTLPTVEDPEEVPCWSESGYAVVAEMDINYTTEPDAIDEAQRLSVEIVKGLDGILYASDLDTFFTKESL